MPCFTGKVKLNRAFVNVMLLWHVKMSYVFNNLIGSMLGEKFLNFAPKGSFQLPHLCLCIQCLCVTIIENLSLLWLKKEFKKSSLIKRNLADLGFQFWVLWLHSWKSTPEDLISFVAFGNLVPHWCVKVFIHSLIILAAISAAMMLHHSIYETRRNTASIYQWVNTKKAVVSWTVRLTWLLWE